MAGRETRFDTLKPFLDGLESGGERPALLAFRRGGRDTWSYAELGRRSAELAHGLQARGVRPGDTIGLFAGDRPEWIVACLGILRAGAVPVPIDVQLGEQALRHVLADSGLGRVFTEQARVERLRSLAPAPLSAWLLDGAGKEEQDWRALCRPGPPTPVDFRAEDPAVLFYTSGTTGPPKGVPLSHRNIGFQLETLIAARLVTETDRVLLPLPLHHVYPFVCGMLTPLALGLPLIIPQALTGPQIMRALGEGEATLLIGVPRLYAALLSGIEAKAAARGRIAALALRGAIGFAGALRRRLGWRVGRYLFASLHRRVGPRLRVLASGGAPLPPDLAYRLEGLGWRLAAGYGLTETSPLLTLNPPGRGKLESVGRAVPGTQLRVATATDAPKGAGEIQARGPGVFAGYRNLPDKSAEAFTADGWFRTEDLGRVDAEGYWYVLGRVSTLIVTPGGENVQPEQVEEVYADSPAIREIGVLQDGERLVALIVAESGAARDAHPEQTVRAALQAAGRHLPSYQRVVDFALSPTPLPRTRLGKIQRHLLRERYTQAREGRPAASVPGPMAIEDMAVEDRVLLEGGAPRLVWDWLTRRYPGQRLTPDTSPELDLGVDSIEWLNLSLEIGQRAGVELGEEAIARVQSVRDLLREVAADEGAGTPADPLAAPASGLTDRKARWIAPLSRPARRASRTLHRLERGLVGRAFRLTVQGREHLPPGQFVLYPNHQSLLDPFVLAAALDWEHLEHTYWAGWTGMVFNNPVKRALARLARAVPIDPQHGFVTGLALSAAVLQRGESLIWFPEGQRSPDGHLQAFKPGLGLLLARYPVPAVPVIIRGTRRALPPGSLRPQFTPVAVEFGEPLDPRRLAQTGPGEEAHERILAALQARTGELLEAGDAPAGSRARRRA